MQPGSTTLNRKGIRGFGLVSRLKTSLYVDEIRGFRRERERNDEPRELVVASVSLPSLLAMIYCIDLT